MADEVDWTLKSKHLPSDLRRLSTEIHPFEHLLLSFACFSVLPSSRFTVNQIIL